MRLVSRKVLAGFPRTYVGAALDEIARRSLRRARKAAITEDLDAKVGEVVYIEGLRTELPYPEGPLASRKASETDDPLMLHYADGTPYMNAFDYMARVFDQEEEKEDE
jgi:hypothetical protein